MFNEVTTYLTGYVEEVFNNGTVALLHFGGYSTNEYPLNVTIEQLNTCQYYAGKAFEITVMAFNQVVEEKPFSDILPSLALPTLGIASVAILCAYQLHKKLKPSSPRDELEGRLLRTSTRCA